MAVLKQVIQNFLAFPSQHHRTILAIADLLIGFARHSSQHNRTKADGPNTKVAAPTSVPFLAFVCRVGVALILRFVSPSSIYHVQIPILFVH